MTKRECAIVMAFAGVAMLKGDDLDIFYQYLAEIMGRPIFSHEIAILADEIKESARADFIRICREANTEAEPVRRGRWLNTDETVWDAKDIDGKQQLEISIVAARCSVCNRWAEQVNNFPPYMKYEFCPHCGAKMDGGAEK